MKKRFAAMLLALVMLLSLAPVTAMAEGDPGDGSGDQLLPDSDSTAYGAENEITIIDTIQVSGIAFPQGGSKATYDFTLAEADKYITPGIYMYWCETDTMPESAQDVEAGDWYNVYGNLTFRGDKYYTAVLELYPKDGYQFQQDTTRMNATCDGSVATYMHLYPQMESYFYFVFGQPTPGSTQIDTVTITDVTVPEAVQKASYHFSIPENAGYSIGDGEGLDCAWAKSETAPAEYSDLEDLYWISEREFTFEGGYYYTLIACLHTEEDFTFGDTLTATINGQAANAWEWTEGCLDVWFSFYVEGSESEDSLIREVTITDVAAPVAGAWAEYTFTLANPDQYDLSYTELIWVRLDSVPLDYHEIDDAYWYEAGDELIFDEDYYYAMILIAKPLAPYRFVQDEALINVSINGEPATFIDLYWGDEAYFYYFFGKPAVPQEIGEIRIDNVVEPVAGENASFHFTIPEDANYSIGDGEGLDCAWIKSETAPWDYDEVKAMEWIHEDEGLVFEPGYYYTLVACVNANDGYVFADSIAATVNGENAGAYEWTEDMDGWEAVDIWYTFYVGAESEDEIIREVTINDIVAPVAGEMASGTVTVVEEDKFATVILVWAELDEEPKSFLEVDAARWYYPDEELVFQEGKYYVAIAITIPEIGYSFPEDTADLYATMNGEDTTFMDLYGATDGYFYYNFGKLTTEPEPVDPDNYPTGDSSQPVLWAAAMLLGAMALMATVYTGKKRRAG